MVAVNPAIVRSSQSVRRPARMIGASVAVVGALAVAGIVVAVTSHPSPPPAQQVAETTAAPVSPAFPAPSPAVTPAPIPAAPAAGSQQLAVNPPASSPIRHDVRHARAEGSDTAPSAVTSGVDASATAPMAPAAQAPTPVAPPVMAAPAGVAPTVQPQAAPDSTPPASSTPDTPAATPPQL